MYLCIYLCIYKSIFPRETEIHEENSHSMAGITPPSKHKNV